ncbi:hypothetical protein Tco_0918510 [Tanacetum coccineum]
MHDNTMTCTRPDIAYAVGRLSRHISSPGKEHWDAVNRAFKYLKQTMDYGLEYIGDPSVLEVSWGSKKQSCLTDSTMSSEFVALASCCKEVEWLWDLLINIPLWPKPMPPISMHYDSQSTLSRAYNGKSRHIKLRHRRVNQLINDGVITIVLSYENNLDKVHLSECGSEAASYEFKGLNLKHSEKPS